MADTEETGHDLGIENQDDLALVERMQEGRDKIVAEIKKVIIGQEDIIDEYVNTHLVKVENEVLAKV